MCVDQMTVASGRSTGLIADGDTRVTIALLDRLTHRYVIVETGNTRWRF